MKVSLVIIFLFVKIICFSQFTDLTSYLPSEYVIDGSIDYTEYLQKGLNENDKVVFPPFPVLINENGLYLQSNQVVNFVKNSILVMMPNDKERYGILNLINISNVEINNPILIGDRKKHLTTKGEWGMGINVLSSSNIYINSPIISNCWGDGIYIGEIPYKERLNYNLDSFFCYNIEIKGGILDNNRRNGISVISVKKLIIEDILIQNTNGIAPMAGIDIEPNNNEQFLENITVNRVTTKNNNEVGIKFVSSNFIGKRIKNVSITIEDCKDYDSKIGLFIGGIRSSNKGKHLVKLEGFVKIINFETNSNEIPIKYGSIQKFNPMFFVESLKIYQHRKRAIKMEEKYFNELSFKNFKIK